jgi:hypothetical protein
MATVDGGREQLHLTERQDLTLFRPLNRGTLDAKGIAPDLVLRNPCTHPRVPAMRRPAECHLVRTFTANILQREYCFTYAVTPRGATSSQRG